MLNNPMMNSGRRGGQLVRKGNVPLSENQDAIEEIESIDLFQKNLERTERRTQKRTLTYQPKKSERIRPD